MNVPNVRSKMKTKTASNGLIKGIVQQNSSSTCRKSVLNHVVSVVNISLRVHKKSVHFCCVIQ